jgi:hypothetical protein
MKLIHADILSNYVIPNGRKTGGILNKTLIRDYHLPDPSFPHRRESKINHSGLICSQQKIPILSEDGDRMAVCNSEINFFVFALMDPSRPGGRDGDYK